MWLEPVRVPQAPARLAHFTLAVQACKVRRWAIAREIKLPLDIAQRDQGGLFDDFFWYISPHWWTNLAADAGAVAPAIVTGAPGVGGVLSFGTGATLNNEVAIYSTNAPFLVANNRPLFAEARIQYAEASTNLANIALALSDSATLSDVLVDGGAGPRTTGNNLLLYKVAGGTVWRANARNGTQVGDNVSTTTAGGTPFTILRIEVKDMSSTQMTVTYSVDGVMLRDAQSGQAINHQLNISGSAALRLGLYAKAGGAFSEVLNVDYLAGYQVRF